tara:strand:+ start:631 stop:1413 length:783 start_codon:yes stop_codon:yes gene_type:complete
MEMDRHEFYEELKLRKVIREGIREIFKEEKSKVLKTINEEKMLRKQIRILLKEVGTPDVEVSPERSTGINVLEDLLKKIIPTLETDYKKLTTSKEQRDSFRAHIIAAADKSLKPVELNKLDEEMEEQIELNVSDEPDPAFIDIEDSEAGEEEIEPPDERDSFGVEGQNLTGRNIAFEAFKKVENQIIDAYDVLSDNQDQKLFSDYLLKNLDLYFDKFETEMEAVPDTPELVPDEEADMSMDDQGQDIELDEEALNNILSE